MAYIEVRSTSPAVSSSESSDQSKQEPSSQENVELPQAEFEETVFEFDRIERGTSMSHDFVVKNTGKARLLILFESNTCKCTGVKLGGKLVQAGQGMAVEPGEQTEINLEWAAKTPAGPFRHGARFSTNDPRNSSVELSVNGQVVESSSMKPSELLFGTIKAGQAKKSMFYLMSFLDQKVEVIEHRVTPAKLADRINIEITTAEKAELPAAEALSGLKVSATVNAGSDLGPFRGWLTLNTNMPNAEKLTVPIMGNVSGPVSIFGPRWNRKQGLLNMGPIFAAEGKVARLILAVRGEEALSTKFEVASVDPELLKVSLGEPREMSEELLHVPIEIEVPAYSRPIVRMGEPTSSDALIELKSNHPQAKLVKMRVHFAVSR